MKNKLKEKNAKKLRERKEAEKECTFLVQII
jgi:hypothetical protein